MDYVTTGLQDDLDPRINGFPRRELTVLTGESMILHQTWVSEQVKHNDASVLSTLRPSSRLSQQLPDETEFHAGDIEAGLEELNFDGDAVVIESDDTIPMEQLLSKAENHDVAVILVTLDPSEAVLYTASIVLQVTHEKDLSKNLYKTYLIIKKHIHQEPKDTILTLNHNPEPSVELRKKA